MWTWRIKCLLAVPTCSSSLFVIPNAILRLTIIFCGALSKLKTVTIPIKIINELITFDDMLKNVTLKIVPVYKSKTLKTMSKLFQTFSSNKILAHLLNLKLADKKFILSLSIFQEITVRHPKFNNLSYDLTDTADILIFSFFLCHA